MHKTICQNKIIGKHSQVMCPFLKKKKITCKRKVVVYKSAYVAKGSLLEITALYIKWMVRCLCKNSILAPCEFIAAPSIIYEKGK